MGTTTTKTSKSKTSTTKTGNKESSTVYAITMHQSGTNEAIVCGIAYTLEKANAIAGLFSSRDGCFTDIYEIEPDWYDDLLEGKCKVFYCSYNPNSAKLEIRETSVSSNFGKPYEKVFEDYSRYMHMYTFAKNFGEAEKKFRSAMSEYLKNKDSNQDDVEF